MNGYFDARAATYLRKSQHGVWGSFRRKEWTAVVELLRPQRSQRLIDLGCGAGFYAQPLRERYGLQVTGVDASPEMVSELTRLDIPCILASIGSPHLVTPERSSAYDLALAAGVLEFILNPRDVFHVVAKLLKPQGRFVVLAPRVGLSGAIYKVYHEAQGCAVTCRAVTDYQKIAAQENFRLVETRVCTSISRVMSFVKGEAIHE